MFDVLPPAGIKIVDAKHLVAVGKQPFAEMRADETRTSGDERSYSGKAHRKLSVLLLMRDIVRARSSYTCAATMLEGRALIDQRDELLGHAFARHRRKAKPFNNTLVSCQQ
jgi:hypothetical protein